MRISVHLRHLLLTLTVPFVVNCGKDSPFEQPEPPPPLTSIEVTPVDQVLGEIGETVQLGATGRDINGNVMAAQVFTWASSNPAVVSVDQSGSATAIGNGQATITASSGSVSGQSNITVDNDFDDDGILNSVDLCPREPETVNNLSDTDGCADDSLDFYAVVRLDIEDYWDQVFANSGLAYSPISEFADYTTPIATPCGDAILNNAFYCETDQGVYYDRNFLDSFLIQIGDAAPAFVFAHEIGHHISDLLGWLAAEDRGEVSGKQIELQADCWAGSWLQYVDSQGRLETGDESEAVLALFSIGDPSLGWFDPEGHGSPGQRIDAFKLGFDQGPTACDDAGVFPWASVSPPLEPVGTPAGQLVPADLAS